LIIQLDVLFIVKMALNSYEFGHETFGCYRGSANGVDCQLVGLIFVNLLIFRGERLDGSNLNA
jgi:hypothetical protein